MIFCIYVLFMMDCSGAGKIGAAIMNISLL